MNQAISYPYPVKRINIHEGIEMAYMDEGEGPETIIFIHGLANYGPAWKFQLAALWKDYRCIAVDLPGNGLSTRGAYPYTVFFYAECIKRFIDALGIRNPVIAGHSMGGQISIVMALRYPLLFRKMILIAPAGFEHFSPADKMIMQNLQSFGDFLYSDEFHLENTIRESFEIPGEEAKILIGELKLIMKSHSLKEWKAMCIASINGMLNEQVSQYLPEIKAKTLVIFGQKDKLIPNRLLHALDSPESIAKHGTGMIEESELLMVPHAGHFVHIEKHQVVNSAITKFLEKQ